MLELHPREFVCVHVVRILEVRVPLVSDFLEVFSELLERVRAGPAATAAGCVPGS